MNNKIAIGLILISLSVFAIPGTNVFGTSEIDVFVSGSELSLKQIEDEKVKSDFEITAESVVQVTQGGYLLVLTEPAVQVEKVKVTNDQGHRMDVVDLGEGMFSLFDFSVGAYVLDVIINLPDSDKSAAYETILIILEQNQQPFTPQQIIQQVNVISEVTTRVNVDFDDDNK